MKSFAENLSMIHAVVGRYLDGEDSFEEALASLVGVLRRIPEYNQRSELKPPKLPQSGRDVRTLTPEQWNNSMVEKGITITGYSIEPGPFDPDRNKKAHELFDAALRQLYSGGAA